MLLSSFVCLCKLAVQVMSCTSTIFSCSDDEEIHHIAVHRNGGGFGFSIRGGAEYNAPLCVLRIAEGGAAETDSILRVREWYTPV